jgi:hypothetical protein
MRFFIVITAVALFSLPVAAHKHKKSHKRAHPAPVAKVVPNDRSAQEHARAEAELSDLRAGKIDNQQQGAEPAQTWAVQENDREVPPNLKK